MNVLAPKLPCPRVLVVDDELGPRESLRMLLKPAYEVRTADNARTALDELASFHPDLVILDIKMPEIDGLEVLRRIKRFDPSIEVVMITAYASLETVKLALSHGAFEYLIKPFARRDLEDVVRRAILRRQVDLGTRGQIESLVEQMRALSARTRQLEEAQRREPAEQSLRVAQLSILREMARAIVRQLDVQQVTAVVTDHLRGALGYDTVTIALGGEPVTGAADDLVVTCPIRDAEELLGYLVVDNQRSGRLIDPREHELLEMIAEYLAIAVRNSLLYTEVSATKRHLEQIVASAGDAIVTVSADDRIEAWNPAAERILGSPAAVAVGRPVTEFLPAVEYADARARLAQGSPLHSFEATTRLASGATVALAVTLSALRSREGAVEGLIAIGRDITAQREIEKQLHQSEKLSALGQLAGGIAHDFNNILQAILGYTYLMKQRPGDADLAERSLDVLESAATDGAETVRRIQQFARLRPDEQFAPIDVNAAVEEAVAITRPRWQETVTHENRPLTLQLDLGVTAPVNGRTSELTELITNLILNAIDAMPAGGRLTIRTWQEDERTVVITVADTGIGMPPAVQRRIFDPFFSTKGEKGSGLGLAMAYSSVKRHGGDIRVESAPGSGSTFTVVLPASTRRERMALEGRVPPAGPAPHRAARVLVIDDDPGVLSILCEMLQSRGHEVTLASSGQAGLGVYAPGRYDAVLTNLGMPGMSGWEVAERLRAKDAAVPILFVTGWGIREEDQPRLQGLGVTRCLFKPVGSAELDAAVQDVLRPA